MHSILPFVPGFFQTLSEALDILFDSRRVRKERFVFGKKAFEAVVVFHRRQDGVGDKRRAPSVPARVTTRQQRDVIMCDKRVHPLSAERIYSGG